MDAHLFERPTCPECGTHLSRIQPDRDRPSVLLAVCDGGCKAWWLIDGPLISPVYRPSPEPASAPAPVGG